MEYTNHSIRSTVITSLDEAGYEACHIMHLSSHKSESTIKEYAPKCSEHKKKEMFATLSNAMLPQPKKAKQITATITSETGNDKTPDIQDVKESLPQFDINFLEYDTIDDQVLANLLDDLPQEPETSTNNNNPVSLPVTSNQSKYSSRNASHTSYVFPKLNRHHKLQF